MDRFQKKVIYESSSAPATSVPVAVGIFVLLSGLMFGAGPFLMLAGLLAVTAGKYPFSIPALRHLTQLDFHAGV